jgi:hypothetical protein
VNTYGSSVRVIQILLLAMLAVSLSFAVCAPRQNTTQRNKLSERLMDLERQQGWHIVVHGMDEISYISQSDGKSKGFYSRFDDPRKSWMGFGSLNPGGRKLTLITEQIGQKFLTIYDIESLKEEAALSRPYLFGARWSPDGTRIAFSCRAGASGGFDLDVFEVKTRRTSRIVEAELPSGEGYFDWSPDGTRIVYETQAGEMRMVDLQGKETRAMGKGGSPRWSPNGKYLLYQKNAEDAVVVRDMQNGESRTILRGKSVSPPIWSPDGRYITYSRPYGGASDQLQDLSKLVDTHGDLWVMDMESSAEVKLFTADESIYPTYWGPIALASPASH